MTLSVCADSALKLSCSVLMCLFFFHCINNSARKTFHLLMMSQKKINSFSGLSHRQRGLTFTLHQSGLDSVFGFFWLLLSCSLRVNCGSFSHPKSNVGFVFVFLSTSLGWLCTTVPKKKNLFCVFICSSLKTYNNVCLYLNCTWRFNYNYISLWVYESWMNSLFVWLGSETSH